MNQIIHLTFIHD